jgi:transcriptional regulator with XRE-family HTH domain
MNERVKLIRKQLGMTQEQLALKSNVSVKYIANIENGKQNPSFDILSSILHVLPLSLDSVINPNLSEAERECRELESLDLLLRCSDCS